MSGAVVELVRAAARANWPSYDQASAETQDAMHRSIRGAVVAVLQVAAEHFDQYDEVRIGPTDVGSNVIPVEPSERLRGMAEEVDDS